jgi:hypothetical protein
MGSVIVVTPSLDHIQPDHYGEGWVRIELEDGGVVILAPSAVDAVFKSGIESRRKEYLKYSVD